MNILITGSSGLIGSEAAIYFDSLGHEVIGVDNLLRERFFGPEGSVRRNLTRVYQNTNKFFQVGVDIRDKQKIDSLFKSGKVDAVIHCAAQPSHDKAREMPTEDAEINLMGTLNLLEATRKYAPEATFIFMSTNKVYGDAPNRLDFQEYTTRYDYHFIRQNYSADHYSADPEPKRVYSGRFFVQAWNGFNESTCIDQSIHSLFGCSKAAADLYVQEYAKSFGLKTVVLRGGCLTGPGHAGVEQHGFLSYLCKQFRQDRNASYTIYGYKGKQVRDNIHSLDVVKAMQMILAAPPEGGTVYNIGGGRENSISILEAMQKLESITGRTIGKDFVSTPRLGDHICYITDMQKFKTRYPNWRVTKSLDDILNDILKNS